ncbi:PAS domain-containing protein [Dyadobacter sp. 3J3]|uniref:PAS domain-containing protein n=1 Tax=Dyadobacter sp. 3J3 TaxID=2606600 RepID=UPI00135A6DAD|nr:PAS domain-containing protein [Dyadobacter sp. 3J3]
MPHQQLPFSEQQKLTDSIDADLNPIYWASDANGDLNFLSPGWIDFTGRDIAFGEILKINQFMHVDDLAEYEENLVSSLTKKESFSFQFRMLTRSEEYRSVLGRFVPLYTSEGKFNGYVGICKEIA